jgi:hypothetical protein
MRWAVVRFMTLVGLLVTAAACTDSPTAPNAATGSKIATQDAGISTSVFLDPVIVKGCDPTITECEDDDGWDSCAASGTGTSNPELGSIEGCGGGGAGADDGGAVGSGGGGGDGTLREPICPDYGCLTPYEEGPLLWAGCVLALVGGGMSVDIVGDKFVAWYDAHKALVSARRALDTTLAMQRAGYVINPADIELLFYKVEQATLRRDDAVGAVEEATGVSIVTLLAAGFTCGAAVAAPTP